MPGRYRPWLLIIVFVAVSLWWASAAAKLFSQEPLSQITITGNDVTSPPSIAVQLYGRDGQGAPIDFNSVPLRITHDGAEVVATTDESVPVGTFTVFLIDIPTGVSEQIPAIQQAIQQFASPTGGMQEQVDAVAIYQVGETEATELLAPTVFYNSVQNLFTAELAPETGSTALIDSLVSVLNLIESIRPDPNMVTSVVVVSDGTDVVSTQFEREDVISRANELDVSVHTIWVSSADLTLAGQEQGQAFLQDVAANTRGVFAFLDDGGSVSTIWSRIAGFRDHTLVRYVIEEGLTGGVHETVVALAQDPAVTSTTSIEVPENQPQVTLLLPAGADTISLPDLAEPVTIRLGAEVSWLDGAERTVSEAALRINGADVLAIPIEQLGDFTAEVTNLGFGANAVEVAIVDDQQLQASNPPLVINVTEGAREVPQELQPEPALSTTLRNIFLILLVAALLFGLLFLVWRRGGLSGLVPRGRSRRRELAAYPATAAPVEPVSAPNSYGTATTSAFLEVLESSTAMPQELDLRGTVIRLGRSPSQSEIAFRDDVTVSRLHASLMLEGNRYRIFDESSTSGTWVNGREVPEYGVQLMDGDEINLGAVFLRFHQP